MHDGTGHGHVDPVVAEVGELEIGQQEAAVGVGVGAHAPLACGRELGDGPDRAPGRVEEILGAVAPEPLLQLGQVVGVGAHLGQRELVGPERPFDG